MKLFIRIKDGMPFEHPIVEENFRQAFPNVDIDNLPDNFAEFVRVENHVLGPYEKNQTLSYQLVDGKYTDVYTCEQMTAEEILAKQERVKTLWPLSPMFYSSWSFNETTCSYEAPVAKPEDGNIYQWRESDLSWVIVPTRPNGEGWNFNIETGLWVKV